MRCGSLSERLEEEWPIKEVLVKLGAVEESAGVALVLSVPAILGFVALNMLATVRCEMGVRLC